MKSIEKKYYAPTSSPRVSWTRRTWRTRQTILLSARTGRTGLVFISPSRLHAVALTARSGRLARSPHCPSLSKVRLLHMRPSLTAPTTYHPAPSPTPTSAQGKSPKDHSSAYSLPHPASTAANLSLVHLFGAHRLLR